jgi:putative membrane protein
LAHSLARRVNGTTPYYNLIKRVAFPSTRSIIVSMLTFTSLGVGLCFLIAGGAGSFIPGAVWGIVFLAIPSLISNLFLYWSIMKIDPLFYLRRCLAFSLFTIDTWLIFLFSGALLSIGIRAFIFPDFAVLMGLFAVMPMRSLAVFSMSRTSFAKRITFALIEPVLSVLLGVYLLGLPGFRLAPDLLLSTLTGLTFAFALIAFVEHYGRQRIGFSPIRMFRAFLTDWLEADNLDLEAYLNELGVETELDVAAFAFKPMGSSSIKGLMLVSDFHPGPFLNIGSSCLPYLFQEAAKKQLGAVALVPHGVSGHELNLVSQVENEKIIRAVFSSLNSVKFSPLASTVTRSGNGIATATCQTFDGCALVTMTTAPSDMEDVPTEVANRIGELTNGKFRHVALIDAHNCLTGPTTMSAEKISALEEAALQSLQTFSALTPFRVGVAHRKPPFQLKDGFGPGGISVIAVEANGRKFGYICIDGNNMVKDLREEILTEVRTLGFDDGEVLTSDTHMVNGIVSARLGYYPVGAVVPRSILLNEIKLVCQSAIVDLEPCEAGTVAYQIGVTTLGSKSLKRVMNVVYKISKLTAIALFPVMIAIAVISLIFLV